MRARRFILFTSVLLIISIVCGAELAHSQGIKYYAGYYLFGYAFTGYSGVLGDIITINPTVSGNNFIAEWVMIVLQYSPGLWLQIGYTKGFDTNYQNLYFCQTLDSYSSLVTIFLGSAGSGWHTYYLTHPYDYGESESEYEWRYYIDNTRKHTQELYPYRAVDQQAFVETTTSSIQINGSHFKRLSYFANQDGEFRWIRWDEHVKVAIPPYWVTDMGNYEFYAYGGG